MARGESRVHMWIESILAEAGKQIDPLMEKVSRKMDKAKTHRARLRWSLMGEGLWLAKESYNYSITCDRGNRTTNIFRQLGLSWEKDFLPLVHGNHLPVEHVRKFRELIESREMPPREKLYGKARMDEWPQYLFYTRKGLLKFLDSAIERNEPIRVRLLSDWGS